MLNEKQLSTGKQEVKGGMSRKYYRAFDLDRCAVSTATVAGLKGSPGQLDHPRSELFKKRQKKKNRCKKK